jgi:competence protein ComFA
LQVIIFNADHDIYDKETLVQIAGRVGRKKEEPTGDIIFLITRITTAISASMIDIREKNEYLHSVYGTN